MGLATTLGISVVAVGCSRASEPVGPVLWNHVDDAERIVYDVLTSPATSVPHSEALLNRLSGVAPHWQGEDDPPFSSDDGTAIFYNYQEDARHQDVTFDLFVTSGIDEHLSIPGWFDPRPSRVYTCYRIEVAFDTDTLWDFRRSHDHGEEQLTCPEELVSALGDGAQYRDPAVFDG